MQRSRAKPWTARKCCPPGSTGADRRGPVCGKDRPVQPIHTAADPVEHFAQARLGPAIGDYDRLIRLRPRLATAYLQRGFAYYKLGRDVRLVCRHDQESDGIEALVACIRDALPG